MLIRSRIKAAILAWLILEALVLASAVRLLGWPVTLVLGLLTSIIGFQLVRRAGRDSITALRRAMDGAAGATFEVPSSGLFAIASGLLLLLPGFVSDLLGLVLLAPGLRSLLVGRFAPAVRPTQPGVVDLDPDEWRSGREQGPGAPCEPGPGMLPGGPKNSASQETGHE